MSIDHFKVVLLLCNNLEFFVSHFSKYKYGLLGLGQRGLKDFRIDVLGGASLDMDHGF